VSREIGTYELLELLGEGGIGQVYAARDTVLGRQVAIKMLRSELSRDRNFITRFYNEAQSLGDLSHTNITTLHALHLEGREPFMVMELVHGHTLEAVLEREHRLPLRESLAVVAQAVAGLAYAHRRGVVHRDIKPSNLMVTDGGLLKIMDFGIARVRGTKRLTRAGQMFGTLLYASPEQIRGNDVDERSDQYSLAVVLYEMLAGGPPFVTENDHTLMTLHLEAPPPPLMARLPNLNSQIEPAVMRALAKKPGERFASVDEFGRALGATAIRGDAADILQEFVGASFRTAPPRTRFVNLRGEAALERGEATSSGARGRGANSGGPLISRPRQLFAAIRSPVPVLGAAATALALGLGYVSWPKPATQPRPQIAAIQQSQPATQPASQSPRPAPTQSSTARFEALKSQADTTSQPPPSAAESPRPAPPIVPPSPSPPASATYDPAPVILQPSGAPETSTSTSTSAPATTPQPEPTLALFEPPRQPDILKPDIQGMVSAVESASRIRVGEQWLNLYGINDPTQRAHTHDVLGYLQPSRGIVECYQKVGGRYQCYAEGKDLAVMALRGGLARAAADAPSEYRSLPPQQKSTGH
jgi:serine/threonine-protein kinase